MRIVVLGATGNVGTALLRRLADDPDVTGLVGVARRPPSHRGDGVDWVAADITGDDLLPALAGADAVVHLAWAIQPERDLDRLWRVNVDGTDRVLQAVVAADVPALVYASSIGAYSPRHDAVPVDESWPTHGVAGSSYSRQKAYVERMLDTFEAARPQVRVVRLRPGLIFQRSAAEEQRRFFAGALLPRFLLRPGVLPVVPHLRDVRFQAVHADDVAEAYRRAVVGDVSGAFNVAADPVLSTRDVADLLRARPLPVSPRLAAAAARVTWRLRLHPAAPGWVELAAGSPVMDTGRIRRELGWEPRRTAREALAEVLTGMREGTGGDTPTLAPGRRLEEVTTGHGARQSRDPDARIPRR